MGMHATIPEGPRSAGWRAVRLSLALFAICLPALAHTVDDATPFHVSAEDYFTVTVGGGVFTTTADVSVEVAPVGGGASVAVTAVTVDPSVSVGVRLPASIAVGEYEVLVSVTGTPQTGIGPSIWVRDRALRFIKKTIPSPFDFTAPGADFKEADFVDIEGDGDMDVFAANSAGSSDVDMLFVNQAADAVPACATPFCEEIATRMDRQVGPVFQRTYDADFVDIDGDGDLDVVRVDQSAATPIRIWKNVGGGQFDEQTIDAGAVTGFIDSLSDISSVIGNYTAELDFGDINNDGAKDLLLCSWDNGVAGRFVVLLNEISATGKFRLMDYGCGGASPSNLCDSLTPDNRGCAFGDFNNDGELDIIAPVYGGGQPTVYIHTGDVNNGDATDDPEFTTHTDWVKDGGANLSMHGGDLKVADLDGDGDDDVALGSPAQGGVEHSYVLWNDNGTALRTIDPEPSPFVGDSYDVSFTDLDADGDLDVVFANEYNSNDNRVLINHGGVDGDMLFREYTSADGIWYEESLFGDPTPAADSSFELSVSFGDYDLDGDRDLVGAGFYDKLDMWENGLFRVDGERRDWVFVLDRTRSMITGDDFFTPAQNTLVAYLGERYDTDIDGGDKVGLVTYDYMGSDATNTCAADEEGGVDVKAQRIFELGDETAATLITHVEGLSVGTCTDFCTSIGAALRAGLEMAEDGEEAGREQVLVLITDGQNNQCPSIEDIIPSVPSSIRVYAVAIGHATDDSALAELASNRGQFYVAGRSSDYASVQAALRDINADLEAHSTGRQVLEPVPQLVLAGWAEKARRPERFRLDPQIRVDDVSAMQVVHRVAVDPDDTELRFTLSWRNPNELTRMVVVDPKGRTLPVAGELIREDRGAKYHVLEVLDPLSGIWLVGELTSSDAGPTKFTASVASDMEWHMAPIFPIFYPDEDLVVQVALGAGNRTVPVSQISASFLSPSSVTSTVAGTLLNEGVFELRLPDPTEPGTWRVTINAFGTPNRPYARKWHQAVHVEPRDPNRPDRRKAELSLDKSVLKIGSGDQATVTGRFWSQDGSPLVGAQVSFVSDLGELTGSVIDHGDGSYSQALSPGVHSGRGEVHARVGIFRFPKGAPFTVEPGEVSAAESAIYVKVGLARLCAGDREISSVAVVPRDAHGNALLNAAVDIVQTGGGSVDWLGPVQTGNGGGVYFREFRPSSTPGTLTFTAKVNGGDLGSSASIESFGPDSPEGQAMGCQLVDEPSLPWWLWLLILLILILLIWILIRVIGS